MTSKKEIKKLIKHVLRHQRGLRDHQIIHPRRDWMVGFIAGLLLLVIGAVWSFITYREIAERDVENVDIEEVQQTVYREDMVNSALEQFRDRKESYQVLLNRTNEITPEEIVDVEDNVVPVEEVVEDNVQTEEEVVNEPEVIEEGVAPEDEQPIGPPTDAPDVESGV